MRRRLLSLILAAVLTASLSACAGSPETAPSFDARKQNYQAVLPAGTQFEAGGSQPAEVPQFDNLLGSLRPDDKKPEERVPAILKRGRIIIGVDQSQNLLSFRDPISGELKGFEIDLAREISQDIFGSPDHVDFRFIDTADRVSALESGEIDVLLRSLSVTRTAQDLVFFSTPYLTTSTRMLVLESSGVNTMDDLTGRTACAVNGSTSLQQIRDKNPRANIMRTAEWADCLVLLQQGIVDAIVANDTILAGMAEQDPYAQIVGPRLTYENYGAAIASPNAQHDTVGLIRQVNSTIERLQRDGTWWKMYNQWFSEYQLAQSPPALNYRKEN
ncbi:glutamate ABC transporter substrate-binding protein [Corynebacterium epidermidicanis]|uniref:Amino acid ABC transporter substrate-binding protein n=1 Tax=Corynebacterium epidermidicanis TaxID=1050174 RepID=A0A0G3GS54_9CORY|nr:glutamate ABC transporter substrate-binding protein [Corynebacterium epidermidicanis]AKK04031.1 amino acid ABC transporter substrate-binding protein [Corynebacterium epidermidicanis]